MHLPSLERPRHRPRQPAPIAHPRHKGSVSPRDMAKQHIRMPRRRFGISRHHQIAAQIQGALQQRCHRGVIGNHQGPCRAGTRHHGCNIHHIQTGVRRRFQIDHRSTAKIGAVVIARRHLDHLNAKGRQKACREHPRDIVAIRRNDQPVALFQHRHQRRRNRRHARGKADHLGLFQQRKLGLDGLPG